MAVEIANVVHALAILDLNNPPSIMRGSGIASVTRLGVGVYEVAADPPLNITEGIAQVTPIEGAGPIVTASIRDHGTFTPGNILISTFTNAGVAADIGGVNLTLMRIPQQL